MAQHQRKHYRRRRRFRFTKVYGVLSVLLILAAIIGGSIVFFRVDTVEVEGNQRYSREEIVDITGIEQGDNMFLINKYEVIDRLLTELTYVDQVSIRRSLPATIQIRVTECTVAAAVQDAGNGEQEEAGAPQEDAAGQWWLVSSSGKLLERTEGPGDYLTVTGLSFAAPSEGTKLAVGSEQRLQLDALLQLLPSMEARGLLADTQSIDLSSASTVTLQYAGRLTVKMKLSSDFDYQMRVLSTVMEEYVLATWDADDTGTLDMTLEDGRPHLIRDAA